MTIPSLDHTTSDMRRGACPALSAPMMTGDGLLARISLVDGVSPEKLAAICRLAASHGNGMIDISARGNLQVRGLTHTSAPKLDADIRALNLPLREGLTVEVPPLAGIDPGEISDPRPLAKAIRKAASGITGLAPKMAIVVDGHGQLRHSQLFADVRLVPTEPGYWKLLLGGTENSARVFNVLRETLVVDTVLELLNRLSALGTKARGRDLAAGLPLDKTTENTARSPFDLLVLEGDQRAVGIGPTFGQAHAQELIALCDAATGLGITSAKPAIDHSLLFFGTQTACHALQDFARDHGFIVSSEDPRSHIAACSGSPACNSATIPTHEIAEKAAADCADLLDGSFKLHVTGCPKGCAHPGPSALTLCGTAAGVSLVADGKASAEPFAFNDFADTNATLRRLADLVGSQRRPGENSAACLARIGSAQLAAAATGRP